MGKKKLRPLESTGAYGLPQDHRKNLKDTTYRYGLIIETVREECTPTHRTLKSLGRLETDEDLERARELERAYQ